VQFGTKVTTGTLSASGNYWHGGMVDLYAMSSRFTAAADTMNGCHDMRSRALENQIGVLKTHSFSDVLFLIALSVMRSAWSGVVAEPELRRIDWSNVGVTAVFRRARTKCSTTIAAYTGTPATINNAIAACTNGYLNLALVRLVLTIRFVSQHLKCHVSWTGRFDLISIHGQRGV